MIGHTGYVLGAFALALAGLVILMGELSIRRFKRMTNDAPTAEDIQQVADLCIPDPPAFESVEEIHSFYADLKESDPVRAGQAMYAAQLKLHGR